MRLLILLLMAAMPLAGCQQPGEGAGPFSGAKGRYVGVGHYAPGRMWEQLAHKAQARQAGLRDDEQVIIVLDSASGEIRQCGNLSGYCIAMNPWSKPAAAAQVGKSREQLEREDAAEPGAPADVTIRPR